VFLQLSVSLLRKGGNESIHKLLRCLGESLQYLLELFCRQVIESDLIGKRKKSIGRLKKVRPVRLVSPGSHAPAWEPVFLALDRLPLRRSVLKGVPTQEHGNEKGSMGTRNEKGRGVDSMCG
jgi:hypothetical protein